MIFVDGLGAPETPRLDPTDGSWLCVEMAEERGCVTRISPDGTGSVVVARTGKPNGLTVDRDGVIWVANALPTPAILRISSEGVEVWMDAVDGQPMLLPNDLCFGPDGLLYVTDSGMLISEWLQNGDIRPDYATAHFDGRVYQIDPVKRTGRVIADGFRFTNGIAVGPDRHLYVNEMISGDVVRLQVSGADHGRPEVVGNVMSADWQGGFRGPDGMAFGADGRLYCTVFGEGNVAVMGPDGRIDERIHTEGRRPTNVAWGPGGDRHIYVTEIEFGRIEVHETATTALPLYYGDREPVAL